MNRFGRMLRVSLFGESHGPAVGVMIDGCPAGLPLTRKEFSADLERRRPGSRGTTARSEEDDPRILSGLFKDRTTGSPLTIVFENRDVRPDDYLAVKDLPRPGHADLTARLKYGGFHDYRGGGHFSGRLTVGLVAAGVVARKLLEPCRIRAGLIEAGGSPDIETAVEAAVKDRDSVGGIIECRASGVPAGWGEPFFDSVESLISHLIFAIPGVRGIEFGSGFACAGMRGSGCNDRIVDAEGATATNHAGGINGGISNGNELVFRVAVKPTSSIGHEQETVDMRSGKAARLTIVGRHDACIALRMPVIVEAAAALVLADLGLAAQAIPRIFKES